MQMSPDPAHAGCGDSVARHETYFTLTAVHFLLAHGSQSNETQDYTDCSDGAVKAGSGVNVST